MTACKDSPESSTKTRVDSKKKRPKQSENNRLHNIEDSPGVQVYKRMKSEIVDQLKYMKF